MKFADIKNDVAFRKIFGNEKKTLIVISFLNAVLKLKGDHQIEEVSILNPYQLPRIAGEKASIIDVNAKDKKGRQFIIEMQVADVKGFDKRVQYYTCRDYSMQINRGEDYELLKPTYFIAILDFMFFEGDNYLSNHIILNGETYEHKLKDIQFTFIELKKFHLKENELNTPIEKWVYFIKNAENLNIIPENVDDEGLREAYIDADLHNWNKREWRDYDNSFIAQQDQIGRMAIAEEKAMKKGEEKGERKNTNKVIKRCVEQGMDIKTISKIVDLPIEEVQKIVDEINNN